MKTFQNDVQVSALTAFGGNCPDWISFAGINSLKSTTSTLKYTGTVTTTNVQSKLQGLGLGIVAKDAQTVAGVVVAVFNTPSTDAVLNTIAGDHQVILYEVSHYAKDTVCFAILAINKPLQNCSFALAKTSDLQVFASNHSAHEQAKQAYLKHQYDNFESLIGVTNVEDSCYTIALPYGFSAKICFDISNLSGSLSLLYGSITIATIEIKDGKGCISASKFGFSVELCVLYESSCLYLTGKIGSPFGSKSFKLKVHCF